MANEEKQTEKLTDEETTISAEADKIVKLEEAENRAEARLNVVFGEPTPESKESTSEESDEKKDEQTDESKETDESTSETTDKSETKDESTSDNSDDKSDKQTDETDKTAEDTKLTQAEIRAAIHQGWKQEDIDDLVKTNPGLAKRTCAKLLENTNNLSKKFAELGKKAAMPEPKVKDEQKKTETKTIDIKTLKDQYEDDPIVGVVEQLVNKIASLESVPVPATTTEAGTKKAEAEAAEDAAIGQQIDTFFKNPDLLSYKDFYGLVPKDSKNWDDLTQGQIKNRWEVVNQANLIILGAKQQGVEMSLDEAFEKAHLLTTAKISKEVVRKEIKSDVKKRSKSLTLAPSASKGIVKDGKLTDNEREDRVGQRLKKVFG